MFFAHDRKLLAGFRNTYSTYSVYVLIFFGGLSNGLPGVLTWQSLNLWLYELGYSKALIGTLFITSFPYNCKFFLSPIIEFVELPFFSARYGQKRGWAIFCQFLTMISLCTLSFSLSHQYLLCTILSCFFTSVFSSLNQLATVSHRIEFYDKEYQSYGISAGITGYRIGKLLGRAGALYLAFFLSWEFTYYLLSSIILLSLFFYISSSDPPSQQSSKFFMTSDKLEIFFQLSVMKKLHYLFFLMGYPLREFKNSFSCWRLILLFLMTVNLADVLVLGWIDIFLTEIGFTKITIANLTKCLGLVFALLGGIAAAFFSQSIGFFRLYFITLFLHGFSYLLFAYLSSVGLNHVLLTFIVILDSASLGAKATLLATMISYLARSTTNKTAMQYAFFSSVKSLPFVCLSCFAGLIQDSIGWTFFFFLSAAMMIPSLIILKLLAKRPEMNCFEKN